MKCITFKTKPFPVIQADGARRMAITWKKRLGRTDCNLRPHEHRYYNSDLFAGMLNHAYRAIIGQYAEFCYIDSLPSTVTVDTSKFMAVVTVALPAEFK